MTKSSQLSFSDALHGQEIGHKVNVIVNYDGFEIQEAAISGRRLAAHIYETRAEAAI